MVADSVTNLFSSNLRDKNGISAMTAIISKHKGPKKVTPVSVHGQVNPYLGHRIICPYCGNEKCFYEIAEDVMLTTRYIQNPDGSFTPHSDESRILGEVKLYCGECQADLSKFHDRFLEMLF